MNTVALPMASPPAEPEAGYDQSLLSGALEERRRDVPAEFQLRSMAAALVVTPSQPESVQVTSTEQDLTSHLANLRSLAARPGVLQDLVSEADSIILEAQSAATGAHLDPNRLPRSFADAVTLINQQSCNYFDLAKQTGMFPYILASFQPEARPERVIFNSALAPTGAGGTVSTVADKVWVFSSAPTAEEVLQSLASNGCLPASVQNAAYGRFHCVQAQSAGSLASFAHKLQEVGGALTVVSLMAAAFQPDMTAHLRDSRALTVALVAGIVGGVAAIVKGFHVISQHNSQSAIRELQIAQEKLFDPASAGSFEQKRAQMIAAVVVELLSATLDSETKRDLRRFQRQHSARDAELPETLKAKLQAPVEAAVAAANHYDQQLVGLRVLGFGPGPLTEMVTAAKRSEGSRFPSIDQAVADGRESSGLTDEAVWAEALKVYELTQILKTEVAREKAKQIAAAVLYS